MNKTVENVLNDVILMLILTVFILIGYMGKYCYFGMFKFIMVYKHLCTSGVYKTNSTGFIKFVTVQPFIS